MKPMAFWLALLVLSAAAVHAQAKIEVDSVDVGLSNDFPIGDYHDKSAYNLGLAAQLNARIPQIPHLRPFVALDNNYWIATPSWIHFGTQVNLLLGASYLYPLEPVDKIGTFSLGGGLAYGLMSHFADADTSGSGDKAYAFIDQSFEVQLQCELKLQAYPVTILVTPRFFFSPEQNDQKYQLGLVTGVRIPLEVQQ